MTPTRPWALLALVAGFAVLGYGLAATAYGVLPILPLYAPVTLVLLALAEAGMTRVIRDRLDASNRPERRQIHPLQIARAAVLAKASSTGGSVLLGGYAGLLGWALPRRNELVSSQQYALVAGLSVLGCLALVGAALLLERACRTPDRPVSADRA